MYASAAMSCDNRRAALSLAQDGQCWYNETHDIVAYLLKARILEPKKQPFIVNGSETTFISRQRP
jgi:hypothetical protein